MPTRYVMLKRAIITSLEREVIPWPCLWERAPPERQQAWNPMIGLEGRCSQAIA